MGCPVCVGIISGSITGKKLDDPNMTLVNNPLASKGDDAGKQAVIDRNIDRLHEDAHNRTGIHGQVYSSIMDMRYSK